VPFASIMPAVRDGAYDAGLVIHEARFTYGGYGLRSMVDLGEWWESDTGLPIPLGAIIARRSLDAEALAKAARASVEYAWANPAASAHYVATHADEMSPDVQRQHIELYVNEFTRDLGDEGYAAAEALLRRAHNAGLIPASPPLR
jgi:1,4-dihydroxy-6-naphthoate synthase